MIALPYRAGQSVPLRPPCTALASLARRYVRGNYFGVESVAPDPRDANVVYAAVGMYRSGPAAILRSMNRGATWQIDPRRARTCNIGRIPTQFNQASMLWNGRREFQR